MLDDSPEVGGDQGNPAAAGPELSSPSRGTAARMVLPLLLVAALVQASDVIGMARPSARPIEPPRFDPSTPLGAARRGGFGGGRLAFGTPQPGRRVAPSDVPSFAGRPLYDLKTLRTIFIQFPQSAWEAELESNYRRDVDVPANLTIDGVLYKDVGVRFRGNSSYRMVPTGFKRSLNLSLDSAHPDQQLGGYSTLNLLNANGDPTFVRTVLYAEIARNCCAAC